MVERVFHPDDMVKIRLKSRQPGPSKFKSEWSGPHQVIRVRGVVVTVREVSTGCEYNTHRDRLSNPIFSKKFAPSTTARAGVLPGTNANPRENPEKPEEDLHPVADPAIALQRSRHGRVLRPRRDPNFDYSSSFLDSVLPLHASTSVPAIICLRFLPLRSLPTLTLVRHLWLFRAWRFRDCTSS